MLHPSHKWLFPDLIEVGSGALLQIPSEGLALTFDLLRCLEARREAVVVVLNTPIRNECGFNTFGIRSR